MNKVQDEVQDNREFLSDEMGKLKSSQKAEKAPNDPKDFTIFQQNINFMLEKSMQHMTDSLFVQAANFTLMHRDSYLEYLKPGVKPDTWCSLRNSLLHHSAFFHDAVIAKAEVDIKKLEGDACPTNPFRVPAWAATPVDAISPIKPTGLSTRMSRLRTRTSLYGAVSATNQLHQGQEQGIWCCNM